MTNKSDYRSFGSSESEIEHKIRELKRFNILSNKYRNERKKYGLKHHHLKMVE